MNLYNSHTLGNTKKAPYYKINSYIKYIKGYWFFYLFLLPAIAATFVFNYLPMLSNVVAFMDWKINAGWMGLGSKIVGFKHFEGFLKDPEFYKLLLRTMYYSFSMLIVSFPASLILALLFNELKNAVFKKTVQTISYIPYFISWVTVAGLVYLFLSLDTSGIVNNIKEFLVGGERIHFLKDPKYFLPMLVISNTWKNAGYGTVVFLAAISSINPEMYESASIDGANRLQRAIFITLPCIVPTIAILLIFNLAGILSTNFEQIYSLQNPLIRANTYTINVYVYYKGIVDRKFELATAIGLFNGVVSFLLVFISNKITKKLANISFFGRFI